MKNIINSAITVSLAAATLVLPALSAQAEIHSKSKELVVMETRDLPEQAQVRGNSLLLHFDNAGRTYLYVEQQQGTRLSVFDVTDPARIKLTVSIPLPAEGAFDFVRPLGEDVELVYFRDGQKAECSICTRRNNLCFVLYRLQQISTLPNGWDRAAFSLRPNPTSTFLQCPATFR